MIRCPHCKMLNRSGSRHCGSCGRLLAESIVEEDAAFLTPRLPRGQQISGPAEYDRVGETETVDSHGEDALPSEQSAARQTVFGMPAIVAQPAPTPAQGNGVSDSKTAGSQDTPSPKSKITVFGMPVVRCSEDKEKAEPPSPGESGVAVSQTTRPVAAPPLARMRKTARGLPRLPQPPAPAAAVRPAPSGDLEAVVPSVPAPPAESLQKPGEPTARRASNTLFGIQAAELGLGLLQAQQADSQRTPEGAGSDRGGDLSTAASRPAAVTPIPGRAEIPFEPSADRAADRADPSAPSKTVMGMPGLDPTLNLRPREFMGKSAAKSSESQPDSTLRLKPRTSPSEPPQREDEENQTVTAVFSPSDMAAAVSSVETETEPESEWEWRPPSGLAPIPPPAEPSTGLGHAPPERVEEPMAPSYREQDLFSQGEPLLKLDLEEVFPFADTLPGEEPGQEPASPVLPIAGASTKPAGPLDLAGGEKSPFSVPQTDQRLWDDTEPMGLPLVEATQPEPSWSPGRSATRPESQAPPSHRSPNEAVVPGIHGPADFMAGSDFTPRFESTEVTGRPGATRHPAISDSLQSSVQAGPDAGFPFEEAQATAVSEQPEIAKRRQPSSEGIGELSPLPSLEVETPTQRMSPMGARRLESAAEAPLRSVLQTVLFAVAGSLLIGSTFLPWGDSPWIRLSNGYYRWFDIVPLALGICAMFLSFLRRVPRPVASVVGFVAVSVAVLLYLEWGSRLFELRGGAALQYIMVGLGCVLLLVVGIAVQFSASSPRERNKQRLG